MCSFITFSKKQPQLPVTGMSCEKVRGCPYYLEQKECKYRKSKTLGWCHAVLPAPEAVNFK